MRGDRRLHHPVPTGGGLGRHAAGTERARASVFVADHRVQISINQDVVEADSPIQDGDEVAFFPPVTGG
ncbi:MAG: MoaD/ThiS family protein [Chromatiaceae bacterium]|nr:MoaD/ThiS family protein [Chromatiaceae bacterium]